MSNGFVGMSMYPNRLAILVSRCTSSHSLVAIPVGTSSSPRPAVTLSIAALMRMSHSRTASELLRDAAAR